MRHCILLITALAGLLLLSCDRSDEVAPTIHVVSDEVIVNPHIIAPLTAEIRVELSDPAKIRIRVAGRTGPEIDVIHVFGERSTQHQIPVVGLYPDHLNTVELAFLDGNDQVLGVRSYEIQTIPLLSALPDIDVEQAVHGAMIPGMTLVSYFGHSGSPRPQRPFIFDTNGEIRWYLDFRSHQDLSDAFYDNGIERLANGNLYFGDASTNRIYEMTMLGEVVNTWEMPGFGFHHHVQEKVDGNFLVTVNKFGLSTVEDHIIEIDRSSGEILDVWDLTRSLDSQRRTYTSDGFDWIHVNSVYHDQRDETIVISGRTQGVFKLTYDNELVWILAPHREWGMSGNGVDMSQFLLQPLDATGQPITDPEVLVGNESHPDFEWPWYQHAVKVLDNGNISLFDNGFRRDFAWDASYSRAVEYEINTDSMTVQQIWSYGKERGEETFSRIVSDVDYLPGLDRVIFSPGAIVGQNGHFGKVVELTHDTKQTLFEAKITPPLPAWDITFHRTERLTIYP